MISRKIRLAAALFVACALPVMAQRTKDEVEKHRAYLEDLFKRVEWLEGAVRELGPQLADATARLDLALERTAKDQDEVRQQMTEVRQMLTRMAQQIEGMKAAPGADSAPAEPVLPAPEGTAPAQDPAQTAPVHPVENSPPAPSPSAPVTVTEPAVPAAEQHRQARSDLLRGRYSHAITGFDTVYKSNVKGPLAAEALFGLAQAHLASGHPLEALEFFQRVPEEFPDSPSAPAALLKAGQTLNGLGRRDEAAALLARLTESYPDSEEARLAQFGASRKDAGGTP